MEVRRVEDAEVDSAFGVLRAVRAWLEEHGRRQRIANTSLQTYRGWQAERANHAVWDGGRIVGVFTVTHEPLGDWEGLAVTGVVPWLRALATHPDHHRRGVGRRAIERAVELAQPHKHLYLDCVSGFLPRYYAANGFQVVTRQMKTYPEEGELDVTLMRREVTDER